MSYAPASAQSAPDLDVDAAGLSRGVSVLHIAETSGSAPNSPDAAKSNVANKASAAHLPGSGRASTSVKLPVELLHPILSTLAKAGSFRALAICARTCRLMYDLTLPYIFQDVYLGTAASFDALITALESSDQYCSLAKADRSQQPPVWTSIPATPGQRLIENFKLTKRITLGDLPDGLYCRRLRKALLKLFSEQGSYGIVPLFPNANLLKIAPIEPYPAGHTAERMHNFLDPLHETPHFLTQTCRPKQLCLHNIYGSSADRNKPRRATQYPFYQYLTHHHLTDDTWPKEGHPIDLNWHGPLRADAIAGAFPWTVENCPQSPHHCDIPKIFAYIRLYLDDTVDMSHAEYLDSLDGCQGDPTVQFAIEGEWAYVIHDQSPFVDLRAGTPGEEIPTVIINFDDSGDGRNRVKLRPIFDDWIAIGSTWAEEHTTRSALASLKILHRSDSLPCPSDLVGGVRLAESTLDRLLESLKTAHPLSADEAYELSVTLNEVRRLTDQAANEAPGLQRDEILEALKEWELRYSVPTEPDRTINYDVRIGSEHEPCPVCTAYIPY